MGAAARINGREHVGREIHIGLHCCVFYCILLQSSNTHYLLIRLLFQNHHTLHKKQRSENLTAQRNSVSVPEAVREILTRNYPIYQCLKMKLMNFHSLAEFIQPQVQQLSGKEASINTLVVAIKRFSDTLANDKSPDASRVLRDARISLSSGIVDVTIRVPRNQFSMIVRELSDVAGELSEFPHIFPLSNSIKLILPAEDYALVHGKMGRLKEAAAQRNVAKVILNLS